MSATGSLLAAVALAVGAAGEPPSVDDVPPVDRQAANFYGAVAVRQGVTAAWAVDPPAVPRDGDVTLTLTVRHAANPHELKRPDLTTIAELAGRFQVLDRPDPPAASTATEVKFTYTLRPREVGELTVPRLRYVYFRLDFSDGSRRQTTYAKAVTVTVTPPAPKPEPTAPPVPLEAPEWMFTLADDPSGPTVPRLAWLLPVAVVPAVVVAWVVVWRMVFPDAARLAKLRRNRAVRRALDRLKAARSSTDPAGGAAVAFRGYLTGRFGVPPAAQTPAEVAAALRLLEIPGERAGDAEAFLRACDERRYAAGRDSGLSLTHEAEALIVAWEEVDA